MTQNKSVYENFWQLSKIKREGLPHFQVVNFWESDALSPIEQIYFDRIRECQTVLDVGAGDLRVKKKFESAGFHGTYKTLDLNRDYPYDFHDINEVREKFDAIVCFDVLEHIDLQSGLTLLQQMRDLLNPGGVLLLQTPNARCIRDPASWDMTHVQLYNSGDLYAIVRALNFPKIDCYRIPFMPESPSILDRIYTLFGRFVTTRLLGCDFADNLGIIAEKSK